MPSPNAIHAHRRDQTLCLLGRYGPLRRIEITAFIFPESNSIGSSEELIRRVLITLIRDRLIVARQNSLGGITYVLTQIGSDVARGLGESQATSGVNSAVTGVYAVHRAIGNSFGAYCLARTADVGGLYFNELQIYSRSLPADVQRVLEFFRSELDKIPDGLLKTVQSGGAPKYAIVEVENAHKSSRYLSSFISLFEKKFSNSPPEFFVDRPIFVCANKELAVYTHRLTRSATFYTTTLRYSAFEIERYSPG